MKRNATALWIGTGKEGKGALTTQSKVLSNTQYSFTSRFEEGIGTNPEELVAAAHAGCFSMKLSFNIDAAGFKAEKIKFYPFTIGYLFRFPVINLLSLIYDKLVSLSGIKALMGQVGIVFKK